MMPTDDDLDAQVAALLEAGQRGAAATAIIKTLGPRLLGYLAAILRDDAAAGDAFSVTCEDLWRGMASFRGESTVRAWAYRISWHAAMRHLRSPYRKRIRPLETGEASALAAEVRTTTAMHLRAGARDTLVELRALLDPADQTLLILRIDRDLSWTEIAGVLGEPDANLRKRFERLKTRLRRAAIERGLIPG